MYICKQVYMHFDEKLAFLGEFKLQVLVFQLWHAPVYLIPYTFGFSPFFACIINNNFFMTGTFEWYLSETYK